MPLTAYRQPHQSAITSNCISSGDAAILVLVQRRSRSFHALAVHHEHDIGVEST